MIKMATTAINCVFDKKKNLEKYFKYIEEASANGSNLVVFAEQSLQGYLTILSMNSTSILREMNSRCLIQPSEKLECSSAITNHSLKVQEHLPLKVPK